jgi:hypothetical protein
VQTRVAENSIGAGNAVSDEMWVHAGKIENRLAEWKKTAIQRSEVGEEEREMRETRRPWLLNSLRLVSPKVTRSGIIGVHGC